jgi:hypothetical protein
MELAVSVHDADVRTLTQVRKSNWRELKEPTQYRKEVESYRDHLVSPIVRAIPGSAGGGSSFGSNLAAGGFLGAPVGGFFLNVFRAGNRAIRVCGASSCSAPAPPSSMPRRLRLYTPPPGGLCPGAAGGVYRPLRFAPAPVVSIAIALLAERAPGARAGGIAASLTVLSLTAWPCEATRQLPGDLIWTRWHEKRKRRTQTRSVRADPHGSSERGDTRSR